MITEHEHNRPGNLAVEREEWQTFREETQYLEREHLELRKGLQDAEAALRADPGNAHLKARVKELRKRLEEIERRAPWLSSAVPIELQLWGICRFM